MPVTSPQAGSDVSPLSPYDGILLLSFGGPEKPEDVMPFLRIVTAGRGIPDERLAVVAGHYQSFGGKSPINDQNRLLLAALRAELDRRELSTPLVWGNRNFHPFLTDALREAHEAGMRRLVTIVTSAYTSYSSCRQYREDLAAAVATLAEEGRRIDVDKVRPYFNHPGFSRVNARHVTEAVRPEVDELDAADRRGDRSGYQDLTAMARGHDPSGPVQRRSEVVAVAQLGLSGGDPHPHR